jgi:large exoprotein involved in heme utilization and adhesion
MGSGNGADVSLSTASSGVISADNSIMAVGSLAMGDSGQLSVATGQLNLTNGAALRSDAQGRGSGGPIRISADSVVLDGGATLDQSTGIFSTTSDIGKGGSITVVAGRLTLHNNANALASSCASAACTSDPDSPETAGGGPGGGVTVSVGGAVTIDSGASLGTRAQASGNAGDVSVLATGPVTVDMAIGFQNSILGGIGSLTTGAGNAGNVNVTAGAIALSNSGLISSLTVGDGNAGKVSVDTGNLSIVSNGEVAGSTLGSGNAGSVAVSVSDQLSVDGSGGDPSLTGIFAQASEGSGGAAGIVSIGAANLTIRNGAITASTVGERNAGSVMVAVAGQLTIDGSHAGIFAQASEGSGGAAGNVSITAGNLFIRNNGTIGVSTFAPGDAGTVTVTVPGQLVLDGSGGASGLPTGIFAQARTPSNGSAGAVNIGSAGVIKINTGTLLIVNSGAISASTFVTSNAGSIRVAVSGQLTVEGAGSDSAAPTGIFSQANSQSGIATGDVSIAAGTLRVANGGVISNTTFAAGNAASVTVSVSGQLTIEGSGVGPNAMPTGIFSQADLGSSGAAGNVKVSAGTLVVRNGGQISSRTLGSGIGGTVSVDTGNLTIVNDGRIATDTLGPGSGNAGTVSVSVAGRLAIDGASQTSFTGISSRSTQGSGGNAGEVKLSADNLSIANGGAISTTTDGRGDGGRIAVAVAGESTFATGGQITSATAEEGTGGTIVVTAQGALSLSGTGTGIVASATSTASGNAGSVMVTAPQIAIISGAEIASTTAGTGMGGSVIVTTPGHLMLDGAGIANTQIAASATGLRSGPGGPVMVSANALTIEGGAQIASSTASSLETGKGGDVTVTVANGVTLSGVGPTGASGITAEARQGSSGRAGEVVLTAGGAIALSGGAKATSSTAGAGNGGTVRVTAGGPVSLTGSGTGIIASTASTASGNAGSVMANAPQITVTSGAEIASTTAGTGMGGPVNVMTPGMLALDGVGTQIAASAIGPQSGPGGSVTVNTGSLTVKGGAHIASSTAGQGRGGDVDVIVASDFTLPDRGTQITAESTGSGDAGSITVGATRLLMNNGAAISTEAATSTANGGNITLHIGDFLYLVGSEISTSVKGETGNGGNIVIDPPLVILDHSLIKADAIAGHGGNIKITADPFISSSDSSVEATSERGISGTVVINGLVNANGALVVLSSQLRGRTEVLRDACTMHANQPLSRLVEAGRGGLPQDPEATLPALYIAGRQLDPNARAAEGTTVVGNAVPTTVHLTATCAY